MNDLTLIQPLNIEPGALTDFRAELGTFVDVVAKSLINNRIKYPEAKFTHYFAPVFLGFQTPVDGQNVFAAWQSEVGSLHTEVDVVDAAGNVLFVVPPLMDTSSVNLQQAESASPTRFNHINQRFGQDSQNFSEIASRQYYNNIAQKLQNIFSFNRMNPSTLQHWLNIYAYYNVPSDFLIQKAREHLGEAAVNSILGQPVAGSETSAIGGFGFDSQITL